MKILSALLFLISFGSFSQENLSVTLQDSIPLSATVFLGVDAYESYYYLKENTLFKQNKNQTYSYQNLSLGDITQVDFLNPLAITVFYKNTNTIIQLDNTLAIIRQTSLNEIENVPTFQYVNTCSNHKFWLLNENDLQLEVYNLRNNTIENTTQPITDKILAIKSNYNYYWILTATQIVQYNSYGSLVNNFKIEGYNDFWVSKNGFLLKKKNELYRYNLSDKLMKKIMIPKKAIQDVFGKAETVYLYNKNRLYIYTIN